MSTLLIDTSALHALHYARDSYHFAAKAHFTSIAGRVKPILTDWIFVETMNLTKARLGPRLAITYGTSLRESQVFYSLAMTDDDKRRTWEIFARYQDKQWSYTDCSLLAVAERLKVTRIFTFDRHFSQMGLEIVP